MRRMEVLADLLQASASDVPRPFARVETLLERDVVDLNAAGTNLIRRLQARHPAPGDTILLDLRDLDPVPLRAFGSVLALDNRHAFRDRSPPEDGIVYYDALPHPRAAIEGAVARILLAPELRELKHEPTGTDEDGLDLLAYSGHWPQVAELDEFLIRYAAIHPAARVIRVGRAAARRVRATPNFEQVERITPREMYRALLRSRVVMSYFGMTFFEGWYGGALPILFTVGSAVHDRLSRDMAARGGVGFVHPDEGFDYAELERRLQNQQESLTPKIAPPDGRGYERLIERLRQMR